MAPLDFQEQFESLIAAYNSGSKNIEDLLNELLAFSRTLTQEETRHVREEEELPIFDILTRPGPELSTSERNAVKKVASHLLERLKKIQRASTRPHLRYEAGSRTEVHELVGDTVNPKRSRPTRMSHASLNPFGTPLTFAVFSNRERDFGHAEELGNTFEA
ncbi:MAG: DUF3387 domain-containing protein [Candidatus Didemnitutus sp.]|nr:DUF3387 domain-containing protein [Candidatus Didemnitutus sp.]